MSRSGYNDDRDDQWGLWRGAVASAMKGKRGQAFLKELLLALDALPEKKLVSNDLYKEGSVCALGAVGLARGLDMTKLDPEDYDSVAGAFDINAKLVQEVVYMNDEAFGDYRHYDHLTKTYKDFLPEDRFRKMREWIVSKIYG